MNCPNCEKENPAESRFCQSCGSWLGQKRGGTHVLIIDDEEDIRALLQAQLELHGYECMTAQDTEAATRLLEQTEFDIALLDMNMPGKSGLDYLPEVTNRYPELAVIMLTAMSDLSLAVEAMQRGAYDYCTKPFVFDDLVQRIVRAAGRRAIMLENRAYQQLLEEMVESMEDILDEPTDSTERPSSSDVLTGLVQRGRAALGRLLG